MKGTVRLVFALGAVFSAIAPVAHAMGVAVDPTTGRIAVLEAGPAANLPPRIYDLAGRPLPAPQAFNATNESVLYVTPPQPPGVYRVVSNVTDTVLAVVQPRSTSSGDDARLARAVDNLTKAIRSLERVATAAFANETTAHAGLLAGIESVAQNATAAAVDVRAARAAAEAIRIPNDLPRRSDVDAAVRTTTALLAHDLATQRVLTLIATTLAAANLVSLAAAFFLQRRASRANPATLGLVPDAPTSPMLAALTRRGSSGFEAPRRASPPAAPAAGPPPSATASASPHPGAECEVA